MLDELTALRNGTNAVEATEDQLNLLRLLEDLVHQGDNARDLAKTGAFDALSEILLASDCEANELAVKAQALVVVGAAASNNREAQNDALQADLVRVTLSALSAQCPDQASTQLLHKRAIYALSSLIRHNQEATQTFLDLNGISLAIHTWQSTTDIAIRRKVVNLLVDLILFATDINEPASQEPELKRFDLLQERQQRLGQTNVTSFLEMSVICSLLDDCLAGSTALSDVESFGELRFLLAPACPPFSTALAEQLVLKFTQDFNDEYEQYIYQLINNIN